MGGCMFPGDCRNNTEILYDETHVLCFSYVRSLHPEQCWAPTLLYLPHHAELFLFETVPFHEQIRFVRSRPCHLMSKFCSLPQEAFCSPNSGQRRLCSDPCASVVYQHIPACASIWVECIKLGCGLHLNILISAVAGPI